jgi:hypothetical protein
LSIISACRLQTLPRQHLAWQIKKELAPPLDTLCQICDKLGRIVNAGPQRLMS